MVCTWYLIVYVILIDSVHPHGNILSRRSSSYEYSFIAAFHPDVWHFILATRRLVFTGD